RCLEPFPVKEVDTVLRQAKRRVLIENNYSGQLAGLIRERTGIDITDKFLKYDGRPINPEEIINLLNV
ncbi:MAG: 2-oxoglutarate ferredoxin oxidoreductase subunit alpha, partial [Parcubacteria group bacterium GW2011_GWA1_43_27]